MESKNPKTSKPILAIIFILGAIGFAQIGERIIKVNAQLNDLTVLPISLDYENVFPEEILDKEFEVSLSDSAIEDKKSINYKIETREKSSNSLCGFMTTDNKEGEGDTKEKSSLTETDRNDLWGVQIDTPCIDGYVPLGEVGACKTISEPGDYDCEIVVTATSAVAGAKDEAPEKAPEPKEEKALISRVLGAAADTGLPVLMVLGASFILSLSFYNRFKVKFKKLKI